MPRRPPDSRADSWQPDELTVQADSRNPFENVAQRRFKNTKNVLNETLKALPNHKNVSDEDVDPDLVARFFDNVKDVSNEEMQKLWGWLLAGEIAHPGTFSFRTLDVLRNLTSKEAQLFQRYYRTCSDVSQIIIPSTTVSESVASVCERVGKR